MTRSPISACMSETWAPIEQLRPMRTPGPMTALARDTVPAPISAPGPTTAPGSIVTRALEPRRADAHGRCARRRRHRTARMAATRQETRCGRPSTKARYGSRTDRTARCAGARSAKRGATRQAPARVSSELVEIFRTVEERQVMRPRAASSGAILEMTPIERHAVAGPRPGEGRDLTDREGLCALEEDRLGHPQRIRGREYRISPSTWMAVCKSFAPSKHQAGRSAPLASPGAGPGRIRSGCRRRTGTTACGHKALW